jgi:hypothetical protein
MRANKISTRTFTRLTELEFEAHALIGCATKKIRTFASAAEKSWII